MYLNSLGETEFDERSQALMLLGSGNNIVKVCHVGTTILESLQAATFVYPRDHTILNLTDGECDGHFVLD